MTNKVIACTVHVLDAVGVAVHWCMHGRYTRPHTSYRIFRWEGMFVGALLQYMCGRAQDAAHALACVQARSIHQAPRNFF